LDPVTAFADAQPDLPEQSEAPLATAITAFANAQQGLSEQPEADFWDPATAFPDPQVPQHDFFSAEAAASSLATIWRDPQSDLPDAATGAADLVHGWSQEPVLAAVATALAEPQAELQDEPEMIAPALDAIRATKPTPHNAAARVKA
jgi:hypothetical protein